MTESKRKANPAVAKIAEFRNKNVSRVRALVIKAAPGKETGTRQLANPWHSIEGMDGLLIPPLDPLGLASLAELSSILRQCVEAMEINIPGFGWRLKQHKDTVDVEEIEDAVTEERARFEEFLTYADWDENSFTKLRRNTRHDQELIGWAFWEALRDRKGDLCGFKQVPTYTVRMTAIQIDPVTVEQCRAVGLGKNRKIRKVNKEKLFRRYAQARLLERYYGSRQTSAEGEEEPEIVWFKEYGDPRVMDWRDGKYEGEKSENGKAKENIPREFWASEIIHHKIYSPRDPHGMARYIGNLLGLMGARSSEEINFTTFQNNNIPSMALLISGGIVTDETVERIAEFVEESIQGSDNYSKFLVIEAIPDEEEGDSSAVRMELKPLTHVQHTDALFQVYDANEREKVRESFRLPPIFVGRSDDYTRATADTGRKIADEQIFDPERKEDDHMMNRLLCDMGMKYHRFVTNTPNITNDQDIIKVIAAAERAGGMTPRIAHLMLEDIMGQDLPVPKGIKFDIPFSLQMAEAVKNKALPNEVGQQVTALKLWEKMKADPEGTWAEILLGAQLEKRDEPPSLSINCGSQALDLATGAQRSALFEIRLGIDGREMLVSDGEQALGLVRFGQLRKIAVEQAAEESGLDLDDVRSMFPGAAEVWSAPIERREKFDLPIKVVHAGVMVFAKV